MKQFIIIIIIIGFCIVGNAYSQCGTTSNGVTTNPDAPSYDDCSNLVNNFDWRDPIYYTPYYMALDSIGSPFFNSGNEAIAEL